MRDMNGEAGRTLLKALAAELALAARVREPLDPDAVAKLDGRARGVFADRDNDADALHYTNTLCISTRIYAPTRTQTHLMPANQRRLRRDRPVALRRMEVGVAHARALHLDEALARREILRLLHGEVGLDFEGVDTALADDRRRLRLGDGLGGHGATEVVELVVVPINGERVAVEMKRSK